MFWYFLEIMFSWLWEIQSCWRQVWRETKWLIYVADGVWLLFHYETCTKKEVSISCKGCIQWIFVVARFCILRDFWNSWMSPYVQRKKFLYLVKVAFNEYLWLLDFVFYMFFEILEWVDVGKFILYFTCFTRILLPDPVDVGKFIFFSSI